MKQKIDKKKEKPENVTYTQSFAATIKLDNPHNSVTKKLVVKSPRWYQYQINKFKDGESVTLVLHNRKPKRTEAQNAYYWGVYLPLVSSETGERNIDRLHELFKGMFLSEGVVDVLGKKVRMKKSTTELSRSEFSMYIMSIEAETSVMAPPTESWGLEPLDHDSYKKSDIHS